MATMDITMNLRVSAGVGGPVQTNAASSVITVSVYDIRRLMIPNGESNFAYSIVGLSTPNVIILMSATSYMRVNWPHNSVSAACGFSAGSNGVQWRDLFTLVASGGLLPSALYFSNSSGDSATFTLVVGM